MPAPARAMSSAVQHVTEARADGVEGELPLHSPPRALPEGVRDRVVIDEPPERGGQRVRPFRRNDDAPRSSPPARMSPTPGTAVATTGRLHAIASSSADRETFVALVAEPRERHAEPGEQVLDHVAPRQEGDATDTSTPGRATAFVRGRADAVHAATSVPAAGIAVTSPA
jgi:hypothetical protein